MKVLVAMSGGVDSSVAAAELRREGHEVVGVTMRLWGGESEDERHEAGFRLIAPIGIRANAS